MMRPPIFIDTNVFIFAFEYRESNSRLVIELLNDGKVVAHISERVLNEIVRYFEKYHTRALATDFRNYVLQSCHLIYRDEVRDEMERFSGMIKKTDLEQLAAAKHFGFTYLVAFDRVFAPFPEYIKPREFVEKMGLEPYSTEC